MKEAITKTFRENDLVKKLLLMENKNALQSFRGFLVKPDGKKKIRLYRNLSLTTYLEVDETDVVHVVESNNDTEPSTVYLKLNKQSAGNLKVVTTIEELAQRPDPTPWGNITKDGVDMPTTMQGDFHKDVKAREFTHDIRIAGDWLKDCHWEQNCVFVCVGREQGSGDPIYKKKCSGWTISCPWWE